jgi:hypothetical protein
MHTEPTLGPTFTAQGHPNPGCPGEDARGHISNDAESSPMAAHLSSIVAENRELRAQIEQLRAERAKMSEILSRLTEVLGSKSIDKLVHDVRNVLNERELYRALADSAM